MADFINIEIERFIVDYIKEIEAGDAAIFAGAGLSAPAGFVDWRGLLRELANELELNVELETDLVALAQFHVNYSGRNRLNQALIDALSADNPPTENHRILARLPISTWWTTNYDQLIERAIADAGKIVDVKSDVLQLANTKTGRDALVYKMHGDISRPNEAVVTRNDYERYDRDRGAFTNALAGDLISKTFLFLGFSFTDPNLDYVLSRVRVTFRENQRRHYAIFKKKSRSTGETEEQFAHAVARQKHVVDDLKRFNISVILVEEYSWINDIMSEIERRYKRTTVFVSASASDFLPWGEEAVAQFMRSLGGRLAANKQRLSTGLGLGVGNALFTGAVEQALTKPVRHIEDVVTARPFPQAIPDPEERRQAWEVFREDLISRAGVAIFLFGNKDEAGATVVADGMLREYEMAKSGGLALLPIGATGSAALQLAKQALAAPDDHLSQLDGEARKRLEALACKADDLSKLIDPIIELVAMLK